MSMLRTAMLQPARSPLRQPLKLDQQEFSPEKHKQNVRVLRGIQHQHEEMLNQNKRDSEAMQYNKYITEMYEAEYERSLKQNQQIALASKWRKPNELIKYQFSGERPKLSQIE